MCGDRNPLHTDPAFAESAGFPEPILHGLCTYGMVCKSVVDNVLAGSVWRLSSYSARFSGVIFQGRRSAPGSGPREVAGYSPLHIVDREDAPVLPGIVVITD